MIFGSFKEIQLPLINNYEYYYEYTLTNEEKALYSDVVDMVIRLENKTQNDRFFTEEELEKVYKAIIRDHPEYYFLSRLTKSGKQVSITYRTNQYDKIKEEYNGLEKQYEKIIFGAKALDTDMEKYQYVVSSLQNPERKFENVFKSYEYELKYVLDRLGIKCIVDGVTKYDRKYNLVLIDGKWYNTSISFKDQEDSNLYDYMPK